FADLPIAIITATPAAAERLVGQSNVACIAKPLDLDTLLASVAETMRLGGLGLETSRARIWNRKTTCRAADRTTTRERSLCTSAAFAHTKTFRAAQGVCDSQFAVVW